MATKQEKPVREEKKKQVEEIADKISRSKEIVLVDYRGLSVKDISELRAKLRKAGVDFKIYKNTLTALAVRKTGNEGLEQFLEGPTAIAFDYSDEVATPKTLVDFAKEHEELELKGALLGGEVLDVNQVKALASLPSREELIAQTVSSIAGTLRSFLYVLNGPIQSFGRVVKQIAEQ